MTSEAKATQSAVSRMRTRAKAPALRASSRFRTPSRMSSEHRAQAVMLSHRGDAAQLHLMQLS